MKIYKTIIFASTAVLLTSSFSLPVAYAAEAPPVEISGTTTAPSIVRIDKDDPIITPMYIPIPYEYTNATFISNGQLKTLLPKMYQTMNAPTVISVFGAFLPTIWSRITVVAGYLSYTSDLMRYQYYLNAYNAGQGIMLIARKNPYYPNSGTYAIEMVATYSPIW